MRILYISTPKIGSIMQRIINHRIPSVSVEDKLEPIPVFPKTDRESLDEYLRLITESDSIVAIGQYAHLCNEILAQHNHPWSQARLYSTRLDTVIQHKIDEMRYRS